jgi:hypothetical protein
MDRMPAQESALLGLYLADRDVPCPSCGYNLRDLVQAACPECGEPLALCVNILEPRQAAPLTGLIALSCGAGMNGLLLMYAAIETFIGRGGGDFGRFVMVNLVGFVVLGACIAGWLKLWLRIRRLERRQRWLLVAACALLTLTDVILFTKLIQ